jgi:hypothetical protein
MAHAAFVHSKPVRIMTRLTTISPRRSMRIGRDRGKPLEKTGITRTSLARIKKIRSEMNGVTNKTKPDQKMQEWIPARRRHHLSHAQEQMARGLSMSPMKLGKLDNHEQEPWKMPLRECIEHSYLKRIGKPTPDNITSIEQRWRLNQGKKEARRAARRGPLMEPL